MLLLRGRAPSSTCWGRSTPTTWPCDSSCSGDAWYAYRPIPADPSPRDPPLLRKRPGSCSPNTITTIATITAIITAIDRASCSYARSLQELLLQCQQAERADADTVRQCLFCPEECARGDRRAVFTHMFQVGRCILA